MTFFIPGESEETFIISSNICHPLQDNHSLTGVAVASDAAVKIHRVRIKNALLVNYNLCCSRLISIIFFHFKRFLSK